MRSKILLVLAYVFCFSAGAQAATYNFIFNNTEQGDNSTANPSVISSNGVSKSLPLSEPSALPVTVSVVDEPEFASSQKKWKVFGGYTFIPGAKKTTENAAIYFGESKYYDQQFTLGLEYTPADRVAFRIEGFKKSGPVTLQSQYSGYSLNTETFYEVSPRSNQADYINSNVIDYSLGVTYQAAKFYFSRSNQISLGLAAGLITVPTFSGDNTSQDYLKFVHQKHFYAGLQAKANLVKDFGIEVIYRNLITASNTNQLSLGGTYVF